MAAIKKIEQRTLQFIEAHAKLKASDKMVTHEELAKIIGVESKTTITEILKKRQNIQPEQWELFRKYFKISTEHYVRNDNIDDIMVKEDSVICLIELKTASGKIIQVKPEGRNEITLLNAFLEERDRVIDTLKEEKQARIDELIKDKEELNQKLNSILERIYSGQQLALAYQKAWVDYEAEKVAKGDQNKKKEIQYKMGKLVDGIIQNDASKGTPDEIGKLRKEGQ